VGNGPTRSVSVSKTTEWTDLVLPFTTAADTASVTIKLVGNTGVVYFDNVVVSAVESDLELIKNGDFDDGAASWTEYKDRVDSVVDLGNKQCKVANGGHADQAVNVASGSTYLITFTGKANYSGQGNLQVLAQGQPTRSVSVSSSAATELSLLYRAETTEVTVSLFGSSGEIIFDNVSMKKVQAH
jgi:uncharacterized protein YjlB